MASYKYHYQILRLNYPKKYYYDIERTKKESFRKNWQILNQVATDSATASVPDEPPAIYLTLSK